MHSFRWAMCALFLPTVVAGALPVFAQANLSDITGPNPSDITGPNPSDITGPNPSDVTGSDASNSTLTEEQAEQLANDIKAAYDICAAGGDCTTFYSLYSQANEALPH